MASKTGHMRQRAVEQRRHGVFVLAAQFIANRLAEREEPIRRFLLPCGEAIANVFGQRAAPSKPAVEMLACEKACTSPQLFQKRRHLDIMPSLVVNARRVVAIAGGIQPGYFHLVEPIVRDGTFARATEDSPKQLPDGSERVPKGAPRRRHGINKRRRGFFASLSGHMEFYE